MSQTERLWPQVAHSALHARDSASMDAAHERGTRESTSLWMKLMGRFPVSTAPSQVLQGHL